MKSPRFKALASLLGLLLLVSPCIQAEPGKGAPSVEVRLTVLGVSHMSAGQTPGQLAAPDLLKLSGVFTEEQLALALKDFLATNGESFSRYRPLSLDPGAWQSSR